MTDKKRLGLTDDTRLRIGAWAALVAGVLASPTILIVALATHQLEVAFVLQLVQAAALMIAVAGLAELLEHLPPNIARIMLAGGLIGSVALFVALALIPFIGVEPSLAPVIAFIAVGASAGKLLVGAWMAATGVAIARGNGRRTGLLGAVVGVAAAVEVVVLWTGVFAYPSTLGGWSLLVGIGEAVYLILVWRFVRAALVESPELT